MDRHLLLDRALHPDEADAELVLEELADRADAAIAEMVDVVRVADALAHREQVPNHVVEVARREDLLVDPVHLRVAHLDVELQTSHAREVELTLVEEHAAEQVPG